MCGGSVSFLNPVKSDPITSGAVAAVKGDSAKDAAVESFRDTAGDLTHYGMMPLYDTVRGIKEFSGTVLDDALGMDGFSRYIDRVADSDMAAQRAVQRGLNQAYRGQVSQGLRTSDDGIRGFARGPAAPVLAALAAYFGQGWLAPYLGAAGAGAVTGAGVARAQGVEDSEGLARAAGTGALAAGAAEAGAASGNYLANAGYVTPAAGRVIGSGVGGAVGGAGATAIRGGDSDEILRAGMMGGATGAINAGAGEFGRAYQLSPWATRAGAGALTGALRGGSEGAERGAITGLFGGLGQQYGGREGAAAASALARAYYANEDAQKRYEQLMAQRQARALAAQQRQGMMQSPAGNSALSRYTPQQLQQMYAQYQAQRRA